MTKEASVTEDEAKRLASEAVREMRYGTDGYFWIDTYEGVNVVLLGGAAEGVLRIDSVDANGVSFMKDIIGNRVACRDHYHITRFYRQNN